jgi:hypothetical protein
MKMRFSTLTPGCGITWLFNTLAGGYGRNFLGSFRKTPAERVLFG